MRLKRLHLINICQHREKTFEFGTGLIGIYGPNGSGKSNAMMAGYAALTNDYSRHELGKSGMICQQAEAEEKSAIELDFSQDNHDFQILRGLRRPEKHLMTGGPKDLKKANEIAAELEDVLGIKRRLIDDHIFVGQWQLFAFLSATSADRAKSFSHLCNTTHAEKIWDILGDQITADTPLADELIDNSDEIRQQIGEYNSRLQPAKSSLAEERKKLVSKTKEEEYQGVVDTRGRHTAIGEEIPGLEEDTLTKLRVAQKANTAWSKAKTPAIASKDELTKRTRARDAAKVKRDAAEGKANTAREKGAKVKLLLNELERKQQLKEQVAGAQTVLEGIVKPEPLIEPASLLRVQEIEKTLERFIEKAEHLVEGCGEGVTECPTCGTPTDQLADEIQKATESLIHWPGELEAARRTLREQRDLAEEHRQYTEEYNLADQRLGTYQAELLKYDNVKPIPKSTIAQLQATINEFTQLKADHDEAQEAVDTQQKTVDKSQTELQSLETKKERLIATHKAAKQSLAEKQEQLVENEVSETEFVEANAVLAQHKQAQVKVAGDKARVEELEGFIAEKREELEQIQRRLARSARARRWVRILTEVRDEVMHRDKLPRVVHQSYLLSMVDDVNDSLADFNAPFHVTATADVGFTAHFSNGTIMPGPGLSGGQKVVLALAFRLTVNSLFAPQLGTMVLDEPTDGLDVENRQMAAEFFRELGTVSRSRGLQIIVITHDDMLERIFDQKVVLDRAG